MRSEPDSWSLRVITASKPCALTASAMASRVGRHDDAAKPAFHGALGDMDDHRPAGNVGQRLARQAGRGHAGGDQDEGGHEVRKQAEMAGSKVSKGLTGTALIGVASDSKRPSFRADSTGAVRGWDSGRGLSSVAFAACR